MVTSDEFTPEEENTISELRNRMKAELPPEIYEDKTLIYKFLKARDFNLKKSEIMLRNHLRFRKEIQVEKLIHFKSYEVLHKHISQTFLGFDKAGCPLRYIPIGRIDGIGIFKSVNSWYVMKHCLQVIETDKELLKKQCNEQGKSISHCVHIYDLDKLSLAQATHKSSILTFMKGVGIFQDNYPEMLKKIYLINAAFYFTLAWPLVKPFLAPALFEKIHIYGKSGWKEALLETIDAEVLPAFLGGKRTDPDGNPLCSTLIDYCGKVPESFYAEKNLKETARKPGMKSVNIERQSRISVPIEIKTPMSTLHWEFEIKCYDIGFGLMFDSPNEETSEELIPIHKLETEVGPLVGSYKCQRAGKYYIVFDNSYSWFHQKDLYYRTWVTDFEDGE